MKKREKIKKWINYYKLEKILAIPEIKPLTVLFVFILFCFIFSCISSFEPQIDKYENLLVVDGILTDEPGSCEVRLSRTYPYNHKRSSKPEINAIVQVLDDRGNVTVLSEKKDGYYTCDDLNFAGEVDVKYKITVETSTGENCESEFEELKQSVPIENVYYKYQDKGNGVKGLQLYVDTFDPNGTSLYYAWDYYETWEFMVPYSSNIYDTDVVCYAHVYSKSFLSKSTKGYSEDRVSQFPLYFIDNTTNRLSVRYSTLIKQYVLTEKTFTFYENLKNINENVGTLYDKIPVILAGNIRNLDINGPPVLGNFQVSGVSEMRIFIENTELPYDLYIPDGYEFCQTEVLSEFTSKEKLDSLRGYGWVVMDSVYDEADTLLGVTISRSCFDCTTHGVPEMPDFWVH